MPVAIEGEHLPTEVGFDADLQSPPVRTTSRQMSFNETVSDSLCRNSSVVQTHSFINCPDGRSQTIPQGKKLDVEVLGWHGYTWSEVVRLVGHTAKFSKMRKIYEKLTFNYLATALVDIPTVSMPIGHLWHCCDKTSHFRVAFYCPQHKVHLCIDHTV